MRADMDKVLVERPRHGRGWQRKGRPVAPQDQRAFECLQNARRSGRGSKSLNENLAPLRRYLARQVDRPWNKVFSEMRERIKPGNTVQEHILSHLDNFLVLHAEKVEPGPGAPCGVMRRPNGHFWQRGALDEGQLYVDPDDGIIKRARRRWRQNASRPEVDATVLGDGAVAVKARGVWYEVALAPYQLLVQPNLHTNGKARAWFSVAGRSHALWDDPVLGRVEADDPQGRAEMAARYGPDRIVVAKRQLSRRELRAHGLTNASA